MTFYDKIVNVTGGPKKQRDGWTTVLKMVITHYAAMHAGIFGTHCRPVVYFACTILYSIVVEVCIMSYVLL